jgi:hypothetical protein
MDGVLAPALTLQRGKLYKFNVQSGSDHPFYLTSSSAGCALSSQFKARASHCPSLGAFKSDDATSGVVWFAPDASTPDTVYYGCVVHCNMGGMLRIVDGDTTGATIGGRQLPSTRCTAASSLARTERGIAEIHGACMFFAFGVLFPVGAFLAHIDHKQLHRILMSIGVVVALVGAVNIFVYINEGRHLQNTHSALGFMLLGSIVIMQPFLMVSGLISFHRTSKWLAVIILACLHRFPHVTMRRARSSHTSPIRHSLLSLSLYEQTNKQTNNSRPYHGVGWHV